MKYYLVLLVSGLFLASVAVPGCYRSEPDSGKPVMNEPETGHGHSDADELVWVSKDLKAGDYQVSLGHHGKHFHIGDRIQPAAIITRNGMDVADAVVFASLVSQDGETVLVDEEKTVFEPKTDDEPAHFAQASFQIPTGAKSFVIRFRIEFPGVDEARSLDIPGMAH